MHEQVHEDRDLFQPLRPTPKERMILTWVVGPLTWVVALAIAAWLIEKTDAIELGALFTAGSFVVSFVVLALLRAGRGREERRYESRSQHR